MTEKRKFDVLVLGGGAAGLMCAGVAGQRGKRVALLEHNSTVGRKILISGGGRANFTNIHTKADNFHSENKHFVKSALAQFGPRDFLTMVERAEIKWHEKTLGQLFCNTSAREIVELLLNECKSGAVEMVLNAQEIHVERRGDEYEVESSQGTFVAPALVVATGGLSIPKIGATSFGYDLARQFGLKIVPTRPALVPLTFSGDDLRWTKLAGVSTDVAASCGKKGFKEKLLFTHRGVSGPAILQASSFWSDGAKLEVDFLATAKKGIFAAMIDGDAPREFRVVRDLLREHMAQRLADRLAEECEGATNRLLEKFEEQLRHWHFEVNGTEGYEKAEVTAGGVDTRELDSKTMMSRNVPGLYFIGEVVDVTGELGGFNFQWAWSSAVAAARAL